MSTSHGPEPEHSALSKAVTSFDEALGQGERVLLALVFATLVLVGLYRTVVEQVMNERPTWAIELVRISAFAIGMFGAAYASQSQRNFGLDLVSALFSSKVKAYVRVLTNLATLFAAGLLYYGGTLVQEALKKEKAHYELIPTWVTGWFIPSAAVLIAIHVICHLIVEIDFLRRGKIAPEPEVAG
ncbi:MAG TPA: TRAP transporter small permease [Kofleriaceae bacterium]|nr:TRAP transporter small permease [Kofleriaceae bacterium]